MAEDKRCETCEWYRIGRGTYGTGRCVSEKSHRKNKKMILKNDTCKFWERSTNE